MRICGIPPGLRMLHYDFYTGNPECTIVMLHGLFGSAKNLSTLARSLTGEAQVYAYDARNHGQSHHTATHNLDDLVEDLGEFIADHKIENPVLLGHSMGGQTAMAYARNHHTRALIILDIAPRTYPLGHEQEIAAQKIAISEFKSRSEIDEVMKMVLPDKSLRQFIQMNIVRDMTGQYVWQNNIGAIESSKSRTAFPSYTPPLFAGPTLAIRGLKSPYVTEADVALMHAAFPRLQMHDIAEAEHWLHYSHAEEVLTLVRGFLRAIV